MASYGSASDDVNPRVVSAMAQTFWSEIASAKRVLVCGCGGGYDFFSALPIYWALHKAGVQVWLGNLTFSTGFSTMTNVEQMSERCWKVTADSKRAETGWTEEREQYWPEMHVARFLKEELEQDVPVYMFARTGVLTLRAGYMAVLEEIGADTIVVVDGGTDSLMFGDEEGLGTPVEDMMTIAAVNGIANVKKFLVCLGLGVDCFHGVSHSLFLENVAALCKDGAFLGSWSLLPSMEEAAITKRAYERSQPMNSIVTSSVLSAVDGEYGNFHHPATRTRTEHSFLYISPLMSQFWSFDLTAVARRVKYLKKLEYTTSAEEIRKAIGDFRTQKGIQKKSGEYTGKRPANPIPY